MKTLLKQKITAQIDSIDVKQLLDTYTATLITDIQKVADAVVGIDRSWGRLEIKSGAIKELIDGEVRKFLQETFHDMFEAEIRRVVKPAKIKNLIRKEIHEKLQSEIRSLCYHSYDIQKIIKAKVEVTIQEAIDEIEIESTRPTP